MRIISGSFKGKKLLQPLDKLTRPLRDLVKESIFNLIQHSNQFNVSIKNSNILDLFAGSGSFGLECLSRGSKSVTFVENYSKAISILKKNILNLKLEKNSNVIEKNCFEYFNNSNLIFDYFDLIFLDPPYKESNINLILSLIIEKKILKKNGIIIMHRHKKDDDEIPNTLNKINERLYGISKIVILELSIN